MAFWIGTSIVLLILLLLWKVPQWQLSDQKRALGLEKYIIQVNEHWRTIAQILGGLVVLSGLAFTYLQLSATQETLRVTQDRLIIDQYAKAVDQLGATSPTTRLGAIYTLGQIAQKTESYQSIIMGVLTSNVRQKDTVNSVAGHEELQACIDLVTHRTKPDICPQCMEPLQLNNVQLANYTFSGGRLMRAHLNEACFDDAKFIGTDLRGIQAASTSFISANATGARLDSAHLLRAQLNGMILNNASLRHCNLSYVNLKGAFLLNADLSGSDLTEAQLSGANFQGANLKNVKGLTRAQLQNAIIDDETQMPAF